MSHRIKEAVQEIFAAGGITVGGHNPWDIRVNDEGFYLRVLHEGSLGLGESYMDGWWDCEALDEFFTRLVPTEPEMKLRKSPRLLMHLARSVILNPGRRRLAFKIGQRHYDIDNELYRLMLGRRMIYSCAYWKNAADLDHAQEAKLDLICRKIGLKAGERILDIGCGWGGFARFAVEKYGASVVGITVSRQQAEEGSRLSAGMPVEIRLQDYRQVDEPFDHVVSVGMFEHVGYRNHRTFMETVRRCLKERGLFLLHTIGRSVSHHANDPWLEKYIFPNSLIPSMKQISGAAEGLFVMEDWHNLGPYYDNTLRAWFTNFGSGWEKLKDRYDERFYRMWKYYLLSSAGGFRSRYLQVWQMVFSKEGLPGVYETVR